jgi:hypothetical protein
VYWPGILPLSLYLLVIRAGSAGSPCNRVEPVPVTPMPMSPSVNSGGATEAVHHAEADRVLVEHGSEHAADGALFAPYFAADLLLIPEVAAIGLRDIPRVVGWVAPG